MRKCGISEKIVNIVRSMYINVKAKYKLEEIETGWVKIHQQQPGNVGILSPLLFSVYSYRRTDIKSETERTRYESVRVGNERWGILYADDVIMMSNSKEDLQEMLNIVAGYGIDFCVKFSESKSKVIVVNGADEGTDHVWQLGDIRVKRTKEYKYLGMTLSKKGTEKVLKEKVAKANQWYGHLASVAKHCAKKFEVLRKFWKAVAVPSIMCGMNVLNWNESNMQKLDGFRVK